MYYIDNGGDTSYDYYYTFQPHAVITMKLLSLIPTRSMLRYDVPSLGEISIVISRTTVKTTYTKALFYAPITFLKKWVKIKNIPVRRRKKRLK